MEFVTVNGASGANGEAVGSFTVLSGYGSYAANAGHTVVVHSGPNKVGCMVLSEAARGGIHVHEGTSCASASAVLLLK